MKNTDKKAIVLASGGLDSTTLLALVADEGYDIYAMSFDYGQRHVVELEAAKAACKKYCVKEHRVVRLDLRIFGHSALTDRMDVPKHTSVEDMASDIPTTYVPARNTIFLSYALAWAEVLGVFDIFIGVNAVDYSGYPDCRSEYIRAFEGMAQLATKSAVQGHRFKIQTPLIQLSKAEIIRKGMSLHVDYSRTHSCYDPDAEGRACGQCDSCLLRKKGFHDAGVPDVTCYQTKEGCDHDS